MFGHLRRSRERRERLEAAYRQPGNCGTFAEKLRASLPKPVPPEEQAAVLLRDVNDLMGALRIIASCTQSQDADRQLAHEALVRLEKRGIGD